MNASMLNSSFGQTLTRDSAETTGEIIDMVTITEKDSYIFPAEARRVRVVSGNAWVSYQRRDITLHTGQEFPFDDEDAATAIATSLGRKTTMLEVRR
jgi:hypothetical protein